MSHVRHRSVPFVPLFLYFVFLRGCGSCPKNLHMDGLWLEDAAQVAVNLNFDSNGLCLTAPKRSAQCMT